MKRQSAVSEPPLKRCTQRPRLRLTAAVADRIIGIALERDARMVPTHPHVECIVNRFVGPHLRHVEPTVRGVVSDAVGLACPVAVDQMALSRKRGVGIERWIG